MKVKVCGITSFNQLQQLQELGVDFAGLIYYENSKRFVGDKLENLESEIKNLKIKKVGVFVNEKIGNIKKQVEKYGLDYVQLHGDESAEFCGTLKSSVAVIKAIRVSNETNLENEVRTYEGACNFFLFDTDSKQFGGSGKQFNWEELQQADIKNPFFLSGGIGLEDVEKLKNFHHPMFFAIDVNSRFETSPGTKDINKVKEFTKALNVIYGKSEPAS